MLTRFMALVLVFMLLSFAATAAFAAYCEKAGTLVKEANGLITKDTAKAELLYQDAVKLCPDSASIHYNLGLAKFSVGAMPAAVFAWSDRR